MGIQSGSDDPSQWMITPDQISPCTGGGGGVVQVIDRAVWWFGGHTGNGEGHVDVMAAKWFGGQVRLVARLCPGIMPGLIGMTWFGGHGSGVGEVGQVFVMAFWCGVGREIRLFSAVWLGGQAALTDGLCVRGQPLLLVCRWFGGQSPLNVVVCVGFGHRPLIAEVWFGGQFTLHAGRCPGPQGRTGSSRISDAMKPCGAGGGHQPVVMA